MAKRKAGVNDIIYELDNDDIEISSDDEVKEPKKGRFGVGNKKKSYENKILSDHKCIEVISLDSPDESTPKNDARNKTKNGGKTSSETKSIKNISLAKSESNNIQAIQSETVNCKTNSNNDCVNTIIFDEDVVLDSPASNSDCGVVGCENKTPLISVRFKDTKLAHVYKKTIKDFLLNLLKSTSDETITSDESGDELDIWPEDLVDDDRNRDEATNIDDGLFFVDTEPCDDNHIEIPQYSQNSSMISNAVEEESPPDRPLRRQTCFNCDGEHQLRECPLPRNNQRIAEKRKTIATKMGRYHVEDDQKYGHLVPGRISATLRNALGLKRYELPLHIYRMRLLGYPPGWLEEARISHSGITLFDSTGNATIDPDEEEGELCEPGSKDKFDIKKILDFPGFNVPASSQYIEERRRLKERYPSLALADNDLAECRVMLDSYQTMLNQRTICEGKCSMGRQCPTGVCRTGSKRQPRPRRPSTASNVGESAGMKRSPSTLSTTSTASGYRPRSSPAGLYSYTGVPSRPTRSASGLSITRVTDPGGGGSAMAVGGSEYSRRRAASAPATPALSPASSPPGSPHRAPHRSRALQRCS